VRILSVGNRYPPWSTGGYETIWAAAVRSLWAAGHPTRVLTTVPDLTDRPAAGDPPADVSRELQWYWRAHAFPRRSLRQCAALERANAGVLASALSSWRPDAVMWWAMGGMSLSLLEQVRRARLPAVAVVADDWPAYGPSVDGWSRRWRGPVSRHLAPVAARWAGVPAALDLDRAARWTFISESTRAGARAAGWRLDDAAVHHPGVDPQRFAPAPAPPWQWRLLYCGRIDPRKGIATAVRALAQLPEVATLTIDGDGARAHVDELESLAGGLGVGHRVRFGLSAFQDVPGAYRDADAVLFPVSWREPWGLVPLEAMAVGRPVIATRAGGGPAEYLRAERNCLQFEPGDAAGLAAAVQRLAGDEALRATLIDGGHATAQAMTARGFDLALMDELRAAVADGPRP
jgi:glycosyltransferase involved in cell wall biosynthesis